MTFLSGRPFRVAGALAIIAVLVNMSWLSVNLGLGTYHPAYPVSATFTKAGQNIYPGSVVDYRGVQVGKVSSIDLSNLQAKFVMKIDTAFKVPTDAQATLTPESFFGNEVVELNFPTGTHPPYVPAGGRLLIMTSSSTTRTEADERLPFDADNLLKRLMRRGPDQASRPPRRCLWLGPGDRHPCCEPRAGACGAGPPPEGSRRRSRPARRV